MEIKTFGNKNNEKILLLHPMFTGAEFFDFCLDKLTDKYYLIIPTLSGHENGSTYLSTEDEEKSIDSFLQKEHIERLHTVIGFSLGGNIAFHYFCHHQDRIGQVIIDSAPIFKFPKFIKRHFYKKYKKCLWKVKENPENAVEELNKCFHGMGKAQQYTAPIVTLDSLKNLIESCYHVETPKLETASQKKITFIYGTEDIAGLCMVRIRKYKGSQFRKPVSMNHCEYFMSQTEEYINTYL